MKDWAKQFKKKSHLDNVSSVVPEIDLASTTAKEQALETQNLANQKEVAGIFRNDQRTKSLIMLTFMLLIFLIASILAYQSEQYNIDRGSRPRYEFGGYGSNPPKPVPPKRYNYYNLLVIAVSIAFGSSVIYTIVSFNEKVTATVQKREDGAYLALKGILINKKYSKILRKDLYQHIGMQREEPYGTHLILELETRLGCHRFSDWMKDGTNYGLRQTIEGGVELESADRKTTYIMARFLGLM